MAATTTAAAAVSVNGAQLTFHPVAEIFPLMDDIDLQELADDIKANGQKEAIWLHPWDGRIIDGRNRYRACILAGVTPATRQWNGQGSLVLFVFSLNLHRRHLTASQKATVAVEILPMLEEEAKQRQKASGGDQKSEEARQRKSTTKGPKSVPAKLPEPILDAKQQASHDNESREQAAKIVGVGGRYVQDAKNVKAENPELFEKVKQGEVSLPAAVAEVKASSAASATPEAPKKGKAGRKKSKGEPQQQEAAATPIVEPVSLAPSVATSTDVANVPFDSPAMRALAIRNLEDYFEATTGAGEPEQQQEGKTKKKKPAARKRKVIEYDEFGLKITCPKKLAAFDTLNDFAELTADLRRIQKRLSVVATSKPGAERLRSELVSKARMVKRKGQTGPQEEYYVEASELSALLFTLKATRPFCGVCPACEFREDEVSPPDCKTCKGLGWVTRRGWETAFVEHREVVCERAAREVGIIIDPQTGEVRSWPEASKQQ